MLRALPWNGSFRVNARLILRRLPGPGMLAGLMFLLMHFNLTPQTAPLAAALMAAGLSAGESAAALAAGCLLGMLRFPMKDIPLLPILSCALAMGMELGMGFLPRRFLPAAQSRASICAGFSVLIPALVHAGGDGYASIQALSCGLLAAICAPFMLPALQLRPGRQHLMLQERAGAAIIACAALAGLGRLCGPAADAAAIFLILILPGAGCACGVIAGLSLAIGGAGLGKTACLAVCALAGSLNLYRARWQRASAVSAACILCTLIAEPAAPELPWALAGAAAYLLLPKGTAETISGLFTPHQASIWDPDRIIQEARTETSRKLRALGEAFSVMAESCAAPASVPDEQTLICEMRSRLCAGCAGYEACWAGADNHAVRLLCGLITDALSRVNAPAGLRTIFSDGEIPPDILRACRRGRLIPDRLGLLLRDFAQKRQSEIKRCATGQLMSVQFMQARQILADLARRQEAPVCLRGDRMEQLQAALDSAGLSGCEAMAFEDAAMHICLNRPGARWNRGEVQRAAAALEQAFGGRFQPELQGNALRFARRTRLQAVTGTSCQSGIAGEQCGDSHMIRMLDGSRLMLAISDGMGSGDEAADESAQALRLLMRFLEAGIGMPLALETVNQQLLMRSCEDMFATMDLCILDMNSGTAEFTKLAACRTLILRGGELMRIEGGSLPLGILERVQPGMQRLRLKPGDMLIMGSDGVMEAGDALMIEHIVRENSACAPEQLAGILVREAGLRRPPSRRDDLTCICARILEE